MNDDNCPASCDKHQAAVATGKCPELPQPTVSSKRKNRNENEKRRRDTFNRLINDLTVLVAGGDRKMDKSNVLKCAINFLQQNQLRAESTSDESSWPLDAEIKRFTDCTLSDIVQLYLETLQAGVFCISCTGHIQHASTSFARHLGHNTANKLCGTNIYDFLDERSAELLNGAISAAMVQSAAKTDSTESKSLKDDPEASYGTIDRLLVQRQTAHEVKQEGLALTLGGYLRWARTSANIDTVDHHSSDDRQADVDTHEKLKRLNFVGVAIPASVSENPDITSDTLDLAIQNRAAFTITYNSTFICIDVNGLATDLLGYSRLEMLGTSGYNYVNSDDLQLLSQSHQQLLKTGSGQVCSHRLFTKSRQWLWVECFASLEASNSCNSCSDISTSCNSTASMAVVRVHCYYKITNAPPHCLPAASSSVQTFSKLFTNSQSTESLTLTSDSLTTASTPQPQKASKSPSIPSSCSVKPATSTVVTAQTLSVSPPAFGSARSPLQTRGTTVTKTSCSARIVIEPLPPKRVRTTVTGEADVSNISIDCTRSLCTASRLSPFASVSPTVSPKHRSQSSLAIIEHYSLPERRIPDTTPENGGPANLATVSDENCGSNVAQTQQQQQKQQKQQQQQQHSPITPIYNATDLSPQATDATLSISPMYRQIWEELQRRSELLRQQVIQKEIELRELHLQKFLSSIGEDDRRS